MDHLIGRDFIKYVLIFGVSLSIATIVMSAIYDSCDSLNISIYLLSTGVLLLWTTLIILSTKWSLKDDSEDFKNNCILGANVFGGGLNIILFVVGSFIFYHGNIDCIHLGSPKVIYALIIWFMTIIICICQILWFRYVRSGTSITDEPELIYI